MIAGVDFKIKLLTVGGKRIKMTIWDTGTSCGTCLYFHPVMQILFWSLVHGNHLN